MPATAMTQKRSFHTLGAAAALVATLLLPGFLALTSAGCGGPAKGQGVAQPIKFRHDVHAGENKIPCQYCHANVTKGAHATIPPVSVCYGCHKMVAGSTDEYKAEIQKVLKYWTDQQPIPWNKVYNVPDYVHFSHKRHLSANLKCEQCHGQVDKMQVVALQQPLSMGFCVKCHRENSYEKNKNFPASLDCMTCHK